MMYFQCDYSEGCHPSILERLVATNLMQTVGYGKDEFTLEAAEKIKAACRTANADVHFMVGGTQTNMTVIIRLYCVLIKVCWPRKKAI